MVRASFYTRISTDEDHQKYSLGAQKERLEASCKAMYGDEWQLFKAYRDTESGGHMDRPGLAEMLADAEARAFDVLLVFKVDRLSRNIGQLAAMVDQLTACGVTLRSITEPFDTSSLAGRMMLQMLGVFAEFERGTIIERTKVGMERKAKTGRFVGGAVPYGYQLDPEKSLVVHEEEAVLVRRIFQMYAIEGAGVYTICKRLGATGYRRRSGKKWDRRVVLNLLRNPIYTGKIRWKQVTYEAEHDAIVPQDLFERAISVLDGRGAVLKGRHWHNADSRILTGVIFCALCGSRMNGTSGFKNQKKMAYYACSKRLSTHDCEQAYMRADHVEEAILKDLKSVFQDEELVAKVCDEVNKILAAERPEIERQLALVDAQMAQARERRGRYFEAFEARSLDPKVCNEKLAEVDAQIAALDAERARLDAQRARLDLRAVDRELVAALMAELDQVFASGTPPQKKHLLHRVVKEVRVHDRTTVEAFYAVPNLDSVRTLTHLAPRPTQCANRIRMHEMPLSIRSWPVSIRRRRLRDPGRRGLNLRLGATAVGSEIILAVPRQQPLGPRGRGGLPEHVRKALVWRALLAA